MRRRPLRYFGPGGPCGWSRVRRELPERGRSQVPLEADPLRGLQGVERIGGRERVQIPAAKQSGEETHATPPRHLRSWVSPSRIRVLTVPSGSESRSATSRYV